MAASKQLFEDAVIPLLTGGGVLSEAQLSSSSPREVRAVREEEVFLRGSTSCEIQSPWTLTGKMLISSTSLTSKSQVTHISRATFVLLTSRGLASFV